MGQQLHREGRRLVRPGGGVGLRRRLGRRPGVGLGNKEQLVGHRSLEGDAALRILAVHEHVRRAGAVAAGGRRVELAAVAALQLPPPQEDALPRGDREQLARRVEPNARDHKVEGLAAELAPAPQVPDPHGLVERPRREHAVVARVELHRPRRPLVAAQRAHELPRGALEDLDGVVAVRRRAVLAVAAEGERDRRLRLDVELEVRRRLHRPPHPLLRAPREQRRARALRRVQPALEEQFGDVGGALSPREFHVEAGAAVEQHFDAGAGSWSRQSDAGAVVVRSSALRR